MTVDYTHAKKSDNERRIFSGCTAKEWIAIKEMYDYVRSEDCDDTLEARIMQCVCGNALQGDFPWAQKAIAMIEGRLTIEEHNAVVNDGE